ncbi:MAG TPA: hypothetical protein VNO33_00700 [Kofleriaceae bacterium]|nr:hypothetical protein [Kofleriaceae bacterium]
MQQGSDVAVESKSTEAVEAPERRVRPRGPYVIRADLQAGTVSVLWPSDAWRKPARRGPRRRRGQGGKTAP